MSMKSDPQPLLLPTHHHHQQIISQQGTPVPGGQQQHYHQTTHHRLVRSSSRNLFILKSLTVIAALTVVVLVINYYLISNCPKDLDETTRISSSGFNAAHFDSRSLVTISVYYEVLCPDSKHFILKELVPVWNKYKEYLRVRLVPFGKGSVHEKSRDVFEFTCQHGPEECHGNKLHACIIHDYPTNYTLQMNVIACSMGRFRLWGSTIESITDVMKQCIQAHIPGADTTSSSSSSSSIMCSNASELLAVHGRETLDLRPRVTFIPTITIDNSQSNQKTILRDLDGVVCKALKNKLSGDVEHSEFVGSLNC